MSAQTPISFRDYDTAQQIKIARECHRLMDRLREEAKTDPTRSAVPSIAAKHFNITVAEAIDLIDFTINDLGEIEAEHIHDQVQAFVDDTGHVIDPLSQIEL